MSDKLQFVVDTRYCQGEFETAHDKLKFVGHFERNDMTQLAGKSIIGSRRGASDIGPIHAINPATGERLCPTYYSASLQEVDEAAQLAGKAFSFYSLTCGKQRAAFLRRIAENIESLGDELVTRATQETALPPARIKTETARTCNQLRLFAEMVEEDSWVDARIDRGDPSRTPPK